MTTDTRPARIPHTACNAKAAASVSRTIGVLSAGMTKEMDDSIRQPSLGVPPEKAGELTAGSVAGSTFWVSHNRVPLCPRHKPTTVATRMEWVAVAATPVGACIDVPYRGDLSLALTKTDVR